MLLRGLRRGSRRRARPLQPRRPLLGLPDRVVQVPRTATTKARWRSATATSGAPRRRRRRRRHTPPPPPPRRRRRRRHPRRRQRPWPRTSWSTSRSIEYVLTPEAQQVVQQAADYAKSGNATQVTVVGHTDTSRRLRLQHAAVGTSGEEPPPTPWSSKASTRRLLKVDWKGQDRPGRCRPPTGSRSRSTAAPTISINF